MCMARGRCIFGSHRHSQSISSAHFSACRGRLPPTPLLHPFYPMREADIRIPRRRRLFLQSHFPSSGSGTFRRARGVSRTQHQRAEAGAKCLFCDTVDHATTCHSCVPQKRAGLLLTAPLPMQLPPEALGKSAEDHPQLLGSMCRRGRPTGGLLTSRSGLTQSQLCGHLGHEIVNGRLLSVSLCLSKK